MRHLKRTAKLGRQFEHRNAMLANMVCSLIKHKRVTTTVAKAKAVRSVDEKMVTLGKSGTLHDRRLAAARLRQHSRSLFKGTPTRKGAAARTYWREHEDVGIVDGGRPDDRRIQRGGAHPACGECARRVRVRGAEKRGRAGGSRQ